MVSSLSSLVSVRVPWYRSLAGGVRDLFAGDILLADLTSKPVLVRDIWRDYGRQKKSWVMSLALSASGGPPANRAMRQRRL